MARKPVMMRVMVIAHGKSECVMCGSIGSNLRIKQEIVAKDKGRSSIQVTGLMHNHLNRYPFASKKEFQNVYDEVTFVKGKPKNFKLFPIMDVDDCSAQQREDYINKTMFKDHWLYDHIYPIYSDPNLEMTMKESGIIIKKKSDYSKEFKINEGGLDIKKVKDLLTKLTSCQCSNLHLYLEYCLQIANEQLVRENR